MVSSTTQRKAEELTVDEAYAAMFEFLRNYFQTTGADEVGALLGGLSLLPDGRPADPGFQREWRAAVEKILDARAHGNDAMSKLRVNTE